MESWKENSKIVIINQAVNYLTIGICNEFKKVYDSVDLITGSIHTQGEVLNPAIRISKIVKWREEHGLKKFWIYTAASVQIYWLLITKYRKHEVFFISLPPMGYLLNIFLRHKFSILIWDVYPDVFKVVGMKKNHIVYKTWAYLNKVSFRKSYRIFTIGDKISELLSKYVNKEKIIIVPIWSIFQERIKIGKDKNPFINEHNLQKKFIVQYSGNIGLTHNVEVLIDIAKTMTKYSNILFQIVGRGHRKAEFEKRVKEEDISNCQFLPFQSDEMFPFSLAAADVGVVILDEKASGGSVPSKSYNLMSYGIPSLYIATDESELKTYADKYGHAKCFNSYEINEVNKYILKLYTDKEFYDTIAKNSLSAAQHFKRENASKIIENYIN